MYHFIINPKSRTGNGLKVWHIVQAGLDEKKVHYAFHFTHYEYHATKLATQICNTYKGIKNIIVLGGDGTMNEVINGIDNYNEVILGYIPSGSSNDLARGLKISNDPLIALDRILTGKHFEYVDHGIIQTPSQTKLRKFAVSMGIGFDASVCFEALNSNIKIILNKLRLGKLTYPVIAIKNLVKHTPSDIHIIVDGIENYHFKKVFFIASMIQKCEGGGLIMTPNASYQDQKLSVCVIYDIPKIKALVLLPSLFIGKQHLFKGVKIFDAKTIEIKADKKMYVHTDGEYYGIHDHIVATCTKDQIRMFL
ncbi:YegS/Rv2252/BmrU family lipid kinase [Mobilisporobacter senegalensis]|uniref:YegS/Rv2252/BmrU family lipid kinase n=1 Tax=Mobilisporobacter senegalensis TaxID=1329262 RepID=A0A3N1XXR4_9FIRM|nr:YegS/Rv2252/BmrU family lipid kinase [Mobilisporobacter senegalensis]ROR31385.1 YegS/Rv2252/BmrU family lipid kinase [Mobilisporobacter senegalensis]